MADFRRHIIYIPQADCPLFKLPVELRILIYEQALLARRVLGNVTITNDPEPCPILRLLEGKIKVSKQPSPYRTESSALALLETCRQIRDEAEDIFYKINVLSISHESLPSFVRDLSNSRLDAITTIQIVVLSGDEMIARCSRALPGLRSLKSIVVQCISPTDFLWQERERFFVKQALARCKRLEKIMLTVELLGMVPYSLRMIQNELQEAIDRKNTRAPRAKCALEELVD